MIWAVFAVMAVVAMVMVLLPLLRARTATVARADYDLAVYKDQLAEIDRDVERGVLTVDQAGAARVEVQRRMLAAAGGDAEPKTGVRPWRVTGVAVVIAVAMPLAAFGFYGLLGTPRLPDQPHAGRQDPAQDMQQQAAFIETMVAQLAARLEQNPEDGKGWAMMGRSLRVLDKRDEALAAYEKAVALLPGDVPVRLDFGGLLLEEVPAGGTLPPRFVALMREVNASDSEQVDALYFMGIAEAQAGNNARAKALWGKLVDLLPPGSEDRGEISRMMEELK